MFNTQFRFYGKHATEVDKLAQYFSDNYQKLRFFDRYVDIMINAPVIGFLYDRMADVDNTRDESGSVITRNVMDEQVIKCSEDLWFCYRLIMLLDRQFEPDDRRRIDIAFRETGDNPSGEERFYQFLRGGIDVLYEKLIENAVYPDDYLSNLLDFIQEINDRFNSQVDMESLNRLLAD